MAKNKKTLAKNVVWDLSGLYSGIGDPKIEKDLKKSRSLVTKFNKVYKGNINSKKLEPAYLLSAIKDQEKIYSVLGKPMLYASLLYSKNLSSEEIGAFYQKLSEFESKLSADVAWFDVEWLQLNDVVANKLINNKLLSKYKHHLTSSRSMKPFILSEKEEVLLRKLDVAGSDAFERLFNIIDTSARYKLTIKDRKKTLTFSELTYYMSQHKDRDIRKAATKALTEGLKKDSSTYIFIMNNLLLDSKIKDELRGFKYPEHTAFLASEMDRNIVDTMSGEIENYYPTVERFYKLKKKILGHNKLYEWDRYNKIYPNIVKKVSWEDTKQLVLDAFESFDKEFSLVAKKFFDNSWIDAPMLDGKRSGAFCAFSSPNLNPFILMNFKGEAEDAMTLAHELGHGTHFYLSKHLPILEYVPSLPVAEVASIFAESLVFDKLYERTTSKKVKINLLADRLQGSFAAVFRQNAFHLFEKDTHTHRREKGELSTSDFNNYYQNRLQAMFGKGLTLTKDHANWWMYVSHFYEHDFYVYSYCFGELLTLALYALYKKDETFAKNYIECLRVGGSLSPVDLAKKMGVDITKKDFWTGGLQILDDYVSEFEELIKA